MTHKRKRRASPSSKGLAAGVQLQRSTLSGHTTSPWVWVGTEVTDASSITQEHVLATCGFSRRSKHPFCRNKYSSPVTQTLMEAGHSTIANGIKQEDMIVISDDESPECSRKACKNNPSCLNYLGQDIWEKEDFAWTTYRKAVITGDDPSLYNKDPEVPVGLKNLGATCYANASLQVWFRDIAFRNGVYQCKPAQEMDSKFMESPLFQLQETFAALQGSTQNVFNPNKLVESLQLKTAEQQDAQEFSKLFISHLDAEFQKQTSPSLKSLVKDQFQGRIVYGTICSSCQYRSERASDFLEIEINLDSNAKLVDCISAFLRPEKLSGDNKYHCPNCNSHQDATRYTELTELPPVLHFSLLRFTFDIDTMERKKSKHTISFPKSVDMDWFLGNDALRRSASNRKSKKNIYELRGVLLHKGASAYHGHYEAQVFDTTTQAWFQFNDEVVTKVKQLGGKGITSKAVSLESGQLNQLDYSSDGQRPRRRLIQRKRKIDNSDEDVIMSLAHKNEIIPQSEPTNSNVISSKDAYMLIYARRDENPPPEIRPPPPWAIEQVNLVNASHISSCEAFSDKERITKEGFNELRQRVKDIYKSWSIASSSEDSIVVSAEALRTWLTTHCIDAAIKSKSLITPSSSAQEAPVPSEALPISISINDILCTHGRLDPTKAGSMRRIKKAAYEKIQTNTHCIFEPLRTHDDVCRACVEEAFVERLYQYEHPLLVYQLDQIWGADDATTGYWIPKLWLRGKLVKPKMHIPSRRDPPPDAPEFYSHVYCEHGNLTLVVTNRTRISSKVYDFLKQYFPSWNAPSTDVETCSICEAIIHDSRENRTVLRKCAENEKARLKHMHDNALNGNVALLEDVPCAVVPSQFIRSWRKWISRPVDTPRPDAIDNTPFICPHYMLNFDPGCSMDMDSTISIIKRGDWDILQTLYPAAPLIAVEKRCQANELPKFVSETPVCATCRLNRKTNWDMTEIIIRLRGSRSSLDGSHEQEPPNYVSRATGVRQSKRLRYVKEHGERRKLAITKLMTVRDIKVSIQSELGIPTICQRLFYQHKELEDNTLTVADLHILANDSLDLWEENEIHDIHTDFEDAPVTNKLHEGRAFGGTLLGGHSSLPTSSREDTPCTAPLEKSCSACTFSNPIDNSVCAMCNSSFI